MNNLHNKKKYLGKKRNILLLLLLLLCILNENDTFEIKKKVSMNPIIKNKIYIYNG